MKKTIIITLFFMFSSIAYSEVTPEIELGVKGVMSGNIIRENSDTTTAVSDFSDSQMLIGFKQKLYNDWRVQMVLGMQFPDSDSNLGQVFYNHVFIKIENQTTIFKLGRSTAQTSLIEFPTLRDDDAIQFNYSLNPFSIGSSTQDNQYANVIELTHIAKQRIWLTIHGEHFSDFSNPTNFSLNSFGGSIQYIIPESQRWNRNIVQNIGLSYLNYLTDRDGYTGYDKVLKNVIGAISLNILPDPIHFINLNIQGIYNLGFSEISTLNNYNDYTKSSSVSIFGTIKYLYRKLERPFIQGSIGFGYKYFPKAKENKQILVISNIFYRLGENFDIGLQYRYLKNSGQTKTLFGEDEHKLQITMIYSIDQLFNNQFDNRDSILNLEHGYIK